MRKSKIHRIRTQGKLSETISAHLRKQTMTTGEQDGGTGVGETETVRIVRYPNRRFYDRSKGRYVTLQEIAATIREGKTVSVRDSKTGDDITSTILTQIILEHYPERMELFPVPVLHLMIRTNGVMLGLLREYFRQSLEYLDFWQRAAAFNPMAGSMQWLKSMIQGSSVAGGGQPTTPTDAAALAQRLAEMERRLNALEPSANKSDRSAGQRKRDRTRSVTHRRSGRNRGRPREKH
jgi:polyhydroxyalkanoate synthesis repressor PhaR